MRLPILAALAATLAAALACGSSSTMDCRTDQVQVDYLRGTRDGETVCKPLPAACGSTASCAVNACIRDMYGYCESPYLGVACSDTFPPTIISCNP
jgi:hypothetical protein